MARHALTEVRSASPGSRAVDLAAELASARLMLDSSQVALDYQPPPASLPPELEAGLALVLREAVTNIARHARARQRGLRAQRRDAGAAHRGRWPRRHRRGRQRHRRHARPHPRARRQPAGARAAVAAPACRCACRGARRRARPSSPATTTHRRCRCNRRPARDPAAARGRPGDAARRALAALLGLESDLEVVGAAADGEAAWRDLQRLQPDLLVTDIEMPGLTGLELAQRIQRQQLPVKVVIVTTFARAGFLRRALDAGVCGLPAEGRTRRATGRGVAQGASRRPRDRPATGAGSLGEADPLNDRERQVLRLAGEGLSAGEIAQRLNLSQGTVRNYLSEAIGKLGASRQPHLLGASAARQRRLVAVAGGNVAAACAATVRAQACRCADDRDAMATTGQRPIPVVPAGGRWPLLSNVTRTRRSTSTSPPDPEVIATSSAGAAADRGGDAALDFPAIHGRHKTTRSIGLLGLLLGRRWAEPVLLLAARHPGPVRRDSMRSPSRGPHRSVRRRPAVRHRDDRPVAVGVRAQGDVAGGAAGCAEGATQRVRPAPRLQQRIRRAQALRLSPPAGLPGRSLSFHAYTSTCAQRWPSRTKRSGTARR